MRENFLPRVELRNLLAQRGHSLGGDGKLDTDIFPPQKAIVTVAMNLDPCQAPAYRERYFTTLVDREECKPLIRNHPDFALPELFATALDNEPIGGRELRGNFLLGPFRWLLRRLVRFPQMLLWPENQIRASDGFMRRDWVLDEMPRLKGWLHGAGPPNAGAIVLDPGDIADCRVLWEVAEQVEAGFDNYFVSDLAATEVYELHHHSKLFISIPGPSERQRLLDELSKYSEVLEDCSGFASDWDDEDWEGKESDGPDPSS